MVPYPDDRDTGNGFPLTARKVRLDIEEEIRNEERFQADSIRRSRVDSQPRAGSCPTLPCSPL